ncbi:nuclear transport factor 2 family protein [Luteolibacter arcticus]|uniref:Nuclear transport factor 2 family protein n=1 Tax=Luteolibacter arcticus TaxID=1581411 RepID=A0ABT3GMK5_9BACT|nr:nuclear transport factor 2 family protein [Luteolibacter arcticus]MCW1924732.1 nuclear transport factor 2 family protein [Luteolibacter arcticus]
MKTNLTVSLALALTLASGLRGQEASPEIAGLEKAAKDFVAAYNKKDAAALAALFTENGEITDLDATDVTTGRADIQARYEDIFAAPDAAQIAIEVDSVRVVGKDLAIEDGTVHATPPGDDPVATSMNYTAVLQKSEDGVWRIASTRDRGDASDVGGELAGLAKQLKGDWTATRDGLRLDIAFGWDDSGNYLIGEMLATAADAKPLTTTIRIGWDPAKKTITWWTFDDGGGFSKGDWTPVDDDSWLIRTEGTTSDGEVTSANQSLTFDGKDSFVWNAGERLVGGEKLPDVEMRVVRQTPEPAVE